ncbi:MAG: hypothetical protein AABX30_02175 [Nanoarchaeota archaeon]
MTSISRVVEKIILKRPFLQEALRKGIVNYYALAEELTPEIEKELSNFDKKQIKTSAVMMALRRLSEKIEKININELKFNEESNLLVRDGLIEVTVVKSDKTLNKIKNLFNEVDYSKGDFLTKSQGIYEVTIITNKKNNQWVKKSFDKKEIIAIEQNLSALTLTIPISFAKTQGFFYLVTRALTWENINIEEIVSTTRELTIILKTEDISRAFDVLKKLVEETK